MRRQREEIAASREAAKKEAAALARRRLRNAQLLQEAALTIFAQANIPDLDEESSRDLLETALKMMDSGMRAERLELGEATETVNLAPPKPIGAMNDEELKDYIALLEMQP